MASFRTARVRLLLSATVIAGASALSANPAAAAVAACASTSYGTSGSCWVAAGASVAWEMKGGNGGIGGDGGAGGKGGDSLDSQDPGYPRAFGGAGGSGGLGGSIGRGAGLRGTYVNTTGGPVTLTFSVAPRGIFYGEFGEAGTNGTDGDPDGTDGTDGTDGGTGPDGTPTTLAVGSDAPFAVATGGTGSGGGTGGGGGTAATGSTPGTRGTDGSRGTAGVAGNTFLTLGPGQEAVEIAYFLAPYVSFTITPDPDPDPEADPGDEDPAPVGPSAVAARAVTVRLHATLGHCPVNEVTGVEGTWSALPAEGSCERERDRLRGWQAGERAGKDGPVAPIGPVFAPGSSLHLTDDTTLYAVWESRAAPAGEPPSTQEGPEARFVIWKVSGGSPETTVGDAAGLAGRGAAFVIATTNSSEVPGSTVVAARALAARLGGTYVGVVKANHWVKPRIVAAYRP